MSENLTMDITKEEENAFLCHYQIKMLGICEHLYVPIQIQSTAVTYFKILFTKRRIFHYDMKNLIVACVLLAMKVENIFITATQIKEQFNFANVKLLAQYELDICNALKFNLHVASPHLRLLGLFLLLKNKKGAKTDMDYLVQTQEISENDDPLNWEHSVDNLKTLMLLENYHTLNLNHVAMASLSVQPSHLKEYFMQDTIEAVSTLKKQMKRREPPSRNKIAAIEKKVAVLQKKYGISA